MGLNKMLRHQPSGGYLRPLDPDLANGQSTLLRGAAAFAIMLLAGCASTPIVTSVDLFCTRVDRFHATDGERETLTANSGPLERLIRWVAGINQQWDETCLKPVPG